MFVLHKQLTGFYPAKNGIYNFQETYNTDLPAYVFKFF